MVNNRFDSALNKFTSDPTDPLEQYTITDTALMRPVYQTQHTSLTKRDNDELVLFDCMIDSPV